MTLLSRLPPVRGKISANVPLAPYTWLRVGGPAEVLFMPKDEADLAHFLSSTPDDIPVTILGVASNTIIRDGGIKGVVVRLGPSFGKITTEGLTIRAGTAALDNRVAKEAAIPGTIGGALRMNAGCYGTETKDVLIEVVALGRTGRRQVMPLEELGYSYRHSDAPSELIFVEAVFKGTADTPEAITARMPSTVGRSRRVESY